MKYYLLNKEEIKKNIDTNPVLIKTKSLSKIKKLKSLQKKVDILLKQVKKELMDTNKCSVSDKIDMFLDMELEDLTEVSSRDYNRLLTLFLLDEQEQRITICNKTEILKGKLYGKEIR